VVGERVIRAINEELSMELDDGKISVEDGKVDER
jgi:hypothetical protein